MRNSNPEEPSGRRNRRPEELSDLDKRIIEHLQQDGRRPFTQIAAALGVSEAAVRARTNRLVERGFLQIVGVADPEKLGFQQSLIGIRCQPGRIVEVAEALATLTEVDYVVITAGRYDILIETVAEDNEDLLRFLNERLQRIDGVRETETFTYLRLARVSEPAAKPLVDLVKENLEAVTRQAAGWAAQPAAERELADAKNRYVNRDALRVPCGRAPD